MGRAKYPGARSTLAAALMLGVILLVLVAHVGPAEAAFPGNNGKIAYVKENYRQGSSGIFTMNPDGSGKTKIGSGYSPSWSADGQKIVFVRFTGEGEEDFGGQAIFVMDADGSDVRQITSGEAYDAEPSFSPDGETVTFAREAYDASADTFTVDVFTVDVDSGQVTNLSNTPTTDETSPVYSPDGSKIAYTRHGATNSEILVMNSVDGSNKQNLTNTPTTEEYGPDWSPDGSKILFTTYSYFFDGGEEPEGDGEIAVMDSADGTPRQNLTDNAADENSPVFSPDGQSIVFFKFRYSRTRGESSDIFVMSADGTTKAKKLTDTRAFEWGPTWQPLPQ